MIAPAETHAYPRHLRACGICMNQARTFAADHEIDWSRFVSEGVPAAYLRATGDHFAVLVAECAEQEASHG